MIIIIIRIFLINNLLKFIIFLFFKSLDLPEVPHGVEGAMSKGLQKDQGPRPALSLVKPDRLKPGPSSSGQSMV